MTDASVELASLVETSPPDIRPHVLNAATTLIETLVERPSDRLILAGTSNLTRIARDFPEGLPSLIEAIAVLVIMGFYYWPLAILLAALFPIYMWLTALTSTRRQKNEGKKNAHID